MKRPIIQIHRCSVPIICDLRSQPFIYRIHRLRELPVILLHGSFRIAGALLQVDILCLPLNGIRNQFNRFFHIHLRAGCLRYNLIGSCLFGIVADICVFHLNHISLFTGIPRLYRFSQQFLVKKDSLLQHIRNAVFQISPNPLKRFLLSHKMLHRSPRVPKIQPNVISRDTSECHSGFTCFIISARNLQYIVLALHIQEVDDGLCLHIAAVNSVNTGIRKKMGPIIQGRPVITKYG